MLSKKERTLWLVIVAIAILATFFLTKRILVQKLPPSFSVSGPTTEENGKTAEAWFVSNENPSIPSRNLFKTSIDVDSFNKYLADVSQKGEMWWTNSPQDISLIFFGYIEFPGYAPDELITYYGYNDPTIVIIITRKKQADMAWETRIDLICTDNRWKVVWAASRVRE